MHMHRFFGATLVAALLVAGCGNSAPGADIALDATAAGTTVTAATTGAATPRSTTAPFDSVTPVALAARPIDRARREITIPSGTALHLSLNTAVASDVEVSVTSLSSAKRT